MNKVVARGKLTAACLILLAAGDLAAAIEAYSNIEDYTADDNLGAAVQAVDAGVGYTPTRWTDDADCRVTDDIEGAPGGLGYTNGIGADELTAVGGDNCVVMDGPAEVSRQLAKQFTATAAGDAYYLGFTFRLEQTDADTDGTLHVLVDDDGSYSADDDQQIGARMKTQGAGGDGLLNATLYGDGNSTITFTPGVNHRVVCKIIPHATVNRFYDCDVYLDPTLAEDSGTKVSKYSTSDFAPDDFRYVLLRTYSLGAGTSFYIDNIKVADSWADAATPARGFRGALSI